MNVPRAIVVLLLAIGVAALGGVVPGEAASAPGGGRVDRPLERLAREQPSSDVRVILQGRGAKNAVAAVQRAGGRVRKQLPQVAGLAVEVRADKVAALAKEAGVAWVMLDAPMRAVDVRDSAWQGPVSVFAQTVGAPPFWSAGKNGRGVAIAVLDSGIQPHPDFGYPSRVIANIRFNERAASTADQLGHGTWVAGIAAGSGAASDGQYPGVAPGASLVNLKVSDDTGAAYTSDVVDALGWVANRHAALNIRVVNLSFVSSVPASYATNVLDAAVEMVWHAGVVVVVSAGNRGANTATVAPANDPYVITVGATDDQATTWTWDNTLAWFSTYGRTQDGFSKPDLVAPGRHIIGALSSTGSGLARQFPKKLVGQRYIQLSGTSASAPVVSGAIAILLQMYPNLTPDQVKWLVTEGARTVNKGTLGTGAGELALDGAARLVEGSIGAANRNLLPNQLVGLAYLSATGQPTVSWDSVSWDSVSWDSVSWDSVSWDSVSWDSTSWDSVSWDSVLGD